MRRFKILFFVLAVLIAAPAVTMAELQLRTIMNGMNDRMKAIVDAINREDFKSIEENAVKIAGHDKPPVTERIRILGFMKRQAPELKGMDDKVHASAKELGESAKKRNIDAVVSSFAKVQKACIACHTKFKAQIVEHFYQGEKK
ncbi:MAG: cytochrome c [Nitrospirae bacterium]|nr:cytochrome c [Nitrospirota bacterium]